ncbi:hypothetical protein [Chitinophaga sp. HK235]|uniref:hypothetical protein n=1 Tax=Chitinophaga sp. HK235 TaxID=2952571 RepID=UPI001BA7F1B3|nr:hypothetical protein [Chitinophaga sp. HK235]
MNGENIVVWFSCGAASAVAAKLTIEKYGNDNNIRVVNTFVAEEDVDNRRFLEDVSQWIGRPIEIAINPKYPNCSAAEVWEKRQYMSGIYGAPCTKELKKEARYLWEKQHNPDWHVFGFTADEKIRHNNFIKSERSNVIPTLIDAGISKAECYTVLLNAGIALPNIYQRGYPNANCIGCVKSTSATYWNHVRRVDPQVFKSRSEQSRRLGVRLVRYKGQRMFLDELPETAFGAPLKSMQFECGIFCEPENIVR